MVETCKDISPERLLSKFFKHPSDVQKVQYYIQWGPNIFVRNTNKGKHWLYRGKGAARRALVVCIYDMGYDCPLNVPDIGNNIYKDYRGHEVTMENIEWWVDELEKRGIIEYKEIYI